MQAGRRSNKLIATLAGDRDCEKRRRFIALGLLALTSSIRQRGSGAAQV